MNKILRNVLVAIAALIGFATVTIVVMKLMGFDIDIDICPGCDCLSKKKPTEAAPTKIKRHYTEIKLPD